MKPKQFGVSETPFEFDLENSTEAEISKDRQRPRRYKKSKISLPIIIVAALILISDGILVSVFVNRHLHRVNDRKKYTLYYTSTY